VIEGARDYTTGAGDADAVGVEALDARTLRIRLEHPTAYFLGLLMHFAAMPVPRRAIEAHGREWTQAENIVVNGPFTLERRVPTALVALRRNPSFYDAAGIQLDGVVFHVQEDRDAAVRRYRAGEFDVLRDFPSARAQWLREQLGDRVVRTKPYLGLTFIAVNHRNPKLGDARVREALALGLEREVITAQLLGSGEQPAYSLVPQNTAHYTEPARYAWADWPRPRRLEEARRLLEAAGYGDGDLKLELRYGIAEHDRRVPIAAQSMWGEIGVDVGIVSAETAVHYSELQRGEFELGIASWLAVYSDPQTFTLLLQSQTSANNFGGYHNARYDELTEQAALAVDTNRRAAYLHEAEALALRENGLIPVFHHASRNLVSARVAGWQDNLLDVHRSRYLSLRDRAAP
jgi:oligopeptide transport system substrate-binding protein